MTRVSPPARVAQRSPAPFRGLRTISPGGRRRLVLSGSERNRLIEAIFDDCVLVRRFIRLLIYSSQAVRLLASRNGRRSRRRCDLEQKMTLRMLPSLLMAAGSLMLAWRIKSLTDLLLIAQRGTETNFK